MQIFEVVRSAVEAIGLMELRISKSQISFRRLKAFVWLWMPGQYLSGKTAPLVLTFSFCHRDESPYWKDVVQPAPNRYTHRDEVRG